MVLILVIGCQVHPWNVMMKTSMQTWDSIQVPGTETIYYCGNPIKPNTDKIIYFPIEESYHSMGKKLLLTLEWCLANKSFDYIARVNSSCYVDKKELVKHTQGLPKTNLLAGLIVKASLTNPEWLWGGAQFILSKDIVEKIVQNKDKWNHTLMEDVALSYLASSLDIPYYPGRAASIDKTEGGWRCIVYGEGESFNFVDFNDIKTKSKHFFYRVKHDLDRSVDKIVMQNLYKVLK